MLADYAWRTYPDVRVFQLETTNTTLEHKEPAFTAALDADAWVPVEKLLQRLSAALGGKPSYAPWPRRKTDVKYLRKEEWKNWM